MAREATEKFVNAITGFPMAFFDAVGAYFGASGPDHSVGLVPDPGSTPGTSNFLREDGTWAIPSGVISPGSVTNAMLADMAQATIKGRASGAGTGPPQDLTGTQATAILDNFVGDSGAGGTKGLVPPPAAGDAAAGKFLKADGTFAVPSALAGAVLLFSGSLPAANNLDITGIVATYSYLVLQLTNVSSNTATREPLVQVSVNNGSTFDATAGNYLGFGVTSAPGLITTSKASLTIGSAIAAANNHDICISLYNYQGGMTPLTMAYVKPGTLRNNTQVSYIGSTSAINALRIIWDGTGNFDSGTYAIYGVA